MRRARRRRRRLTLETLCDRRVLENHAPVLNPLQEPDLNPVTEGVANPSGTLVSAFANSRITDSDPGDLKGIAVVGLTNQGGASGVWQYSLNGGSTWQNMATPAESTALLLQPANLVRYRAAANFFGQPDLTFRAWDQSDGLTVGSVANINGHQGGTGAYSTASLKAHAIVQDSGINDAPVLDVNAQPELNWMNENSSYPTSVIQFAGPTNHDPDRNPSKGIAVLGLTEIAPGKGRWQYQISGSDWQDFPAVSATAALLLGPDDMVQYVGKPFYHGTPELSYRGWDGTDGAARGSLVDPTGKLGGGGAYSAEVLTATQLILDIDSPSQILFGDPITYRLETFPRVLIAPNAVIYDPDGADFTTGWMSSPALADGVFSFPFRLEGIEDPLKQGMLWNIVLDGVAIGRYRDPYGPEPGTKIEFNSNTTPEIVEQLIRSIQFSLPYNSPGTYEVGFRLSGKRGYSDNVQTVVVLPALITSQVSSNLPDPTQLVAPQASMRVIADATIVDPDSPDYGGGRLTAQVRTGANANDRVFVDTTDGAFSLSASKELLYQGTVIAQMSGTGLGSAYVNVDFNANATQDIVEQLLRHFQFQPANGVRGQRYVEFRLYDGSAHDCIFGRRIDVVSATPVLALGDPLTYQRNAPAIHIAPAAAVSDADNENFAGGSLQVTVEPAGANTILAIDAPFVVDATNNVLLNGVLIGARTSDGLGGHSLTIALNENATVSITQQLVRAITYQNLGDDPGMRTVTLTLNDGLGQSGVGSVAVNVVSELPSQPPELALSGSLDYHLNAPAVVLTTDALVSDADSSNFDGGALRVRITVGGGTNNTLAVGGDFTVDSSDNVNLGTLIIGKRLGNGIGTNELTIQFNNHASPSVVQNLVRSITYRNVGGALGQRQIVFTVSDGDGGASAARAKTVNVVSPLQLGLSGSLTDHRNAPAVVLAANATVTDDNRPNLGGGSLRVRVTTGGEAANTLALGGNFTVDGSNNVKQGTTIIGKRLSNGIGTNDLQIQFNTNATPSRVQALVRAITYRNVGGALGQRQIVFTVSDGHGNVSALRTKTVNVVTSPPQLSLSGALSYHRGASAVVLASSATVKDLDSANFGGGSLRVQITSGGGANNTLAIGGSFTVDSSGNVKLGTLIIGKRLSNGIGTNELKIQFNNHASPSVVQNLVRSITYRNLGGSAGERTIAFTVSDGDGGVSEVRTKTVNVT